AVEDYSWLLQNGSAKGLLDMKQNIGLRVKKNMTILCGYDVSNVIDPKQLDKVMGFHGYAIMDHPFRVYRRAGDGSWPARHVPAQMQPSTRKLSRLLKSSC